jgi:hypothetical protein
MRGDVDVKNAPAFEYARGLRAGSAWVAAPRRRPRTPVRAASSIAGSPSHVLFDAGVCRGAIEARGGRRRGCRDAQVP